MALIFAAQFGDAGHQLSVAAGKAILVEFDVVLEPGADVTAEFELLPGSAFTVIGALPGPDSVLASVGAGISFKNGISLAGEFDSQLSQGWQTYGGFGRLRYTW